MNSTSCATLLALTAAVLLANPCLAAPDEETADRALDLAQVHALIVGVLEWQHPGLSSFSDADRQDQLFADTLIERGVPAEQVTVLLDEQATLARIEAELERVAGEAGAGSTLIFYYAGHGVREGKQCFFANYDMRGQVKLGLENVASLLEEHFEGERFLAFADCCHSGGLDTVVDRMAKKGIRAGCVTSVVPQSVSTGNWTFTQTLVEAFAGDASLDDDGDGFVEFGELDDAVGDAMAYRENQRAGRHSRELDPGLRLVKTTTKRSASKAAKVDEASGFEVGDHVRARRGRRDRVGRVIGRDEGGNFCVRFYAYATHEDVALPAASLSPIETRSVAVGTAVGVRRGPDVLAARVEQVDGPFHLVRFPPWPELEGEWRFAGQLVEPPEETRRPCMVLWQGTWYPAVVLSEKDEKYSIHYVGYGANWDEEVGADRIRFPAVDG